MTWTEFTREAIRRFCEARGSRTFALGDFLAAHEGEYQSRWPANRHVRQKVRQQLQVLRDEGMISFVDNSGHYTLRQPVLLDVELQEVGQLDLSREDPEKREYLVETYVRSARWAREAVALHGDLCLCPACQNTFRRPDGTRYIEVHHIVPLCEGGEDGLWNLAVLCAHHHRMSHFADKRTRVELRRYLLALAESAASPA